MTPSNPFDFPPPEPPRFWEISRGRHLAWNEFGDPRGRPVLYFHGWPSSRLQAALAHRLAVERGIRLIAMDRPGIGRSSFEPGRTLGTWPDLMERFADFLGIGKFGQLGVSGGGPYVLACAAKIPHRLTASAVLAGAVPLDGPRGGWRGLHPVYRLLIPLRKLPGCLFSPLFAAAALSTRLDPRKPPVSWALGSLAADDRRVLLESAAVWPAIAASFREGARGGKNARGIMADAGIYFQPLPFALADIRHPVRYWHGAEDRNIPLPMVRAFVAEIPSATLRVEAGMGHFSLVLRRAAAALDVLAQAGD